MPYRRMPRSGSGQREGVVIVLLDSLAGGRRSHGADRSGELEDIGVDEVRHSESAVWAMSAIGTWKVRDTPNGGGSGSC